MIGKFISYLRHELNRSENTAAAYRRDLSQFADWLCGDSGRPFDAASVTAADIRAWLGIMAGHESQASVRRKASALRSFFRWMLRNGYIAASPAQDIDLAKRRRDLPEIVEEKELEAILNADASGPADESDADRYTRLRRELILSILYGTGLRESELLGLTDSDIDLKAREMKVTGKRNKQRVIPLPESLAQQIARWQTLRDTFRAANGEPLPHPAPLIPGRDGAMSRMQLYRIVREALAATSATRKGPHTLRHSFATAMLNGGANLDVVKEMLGHASLATTQIYTHLSFDELMRTYRSAHPRSGGGK